MAQPTVAVVGAGSMGSMTMWQLANAGAKVLGFEQYGIAHDRSAAGGESRMFRTAYMEGANYVPLLQRAEALWRALELETGAQLLTMTGGLMIGGHSSEKIHNVLQSIHEFDLPHEVLDPEQASRRFPQHSFDRDEAIILDKAAGMLRPEYAVFTAVSRAVELGAELHTYTPVLGVESSGDKVKVATPKQNYEVDYAVITTGPWFDKLVPSAAGTVTPRRILMSWFASKNPAAFKQDRFPVFARLSDEADIFGIPTLDGTLTKVASIATFGDVEDADHLDHNTDHKDFEELNSIVNRTLNGLAKTPSRISVHMDGYTPTGTPIVDRSPESDRVFCMGGFSGHGFKLAPVMGQLATEYIYGNTSHLPREHMTFATPERLGSSHAAEQGDTT